MNRLLSSLVLIVGTGSLTGETLEEIADALPIGTTKAAILLKEPGAIVAPTAVKPLDPSAKTECLAWMKRETGMMAQFYLVNEKVSAMMVGRMPSTPAAAPKEDLSHYQNGKKLESFKALRIDDQLNTLDVDVEKRELVNPTTVSLIVNSVQGTELWIVDESVFNPKSFFMEPSDEMKAKLKRSKEMIEEQRAAIKEKLEKK